MKLFVQIGDTEEGCISLVKGIFPQCLASVPVLATHHVSVE